MAPFLVVIAALLALTNAQQDEICVWGRHTYPEMALNGLYRKSSNVNGSQVNGKFYWKLDRSGQNCSSDYYWIWWSNPGWYIGKSSTSEFGFGIESLNVAKCVRSGAILNTPIDCLNNWSFDALSSWAIIDTDVTATWGACPSFDCASISAGYSGINACTGPSQFAQTGPNEYTNAGSDLVWFFNEPQFQWTCTASADAGDSCASSVVSNLAPAQAWQDLSDGQSIVYHSGSGASYTCTGSGGTNYTFPPTTPNPTVPKIPTPHPTVVTEPPSGVTLAPTQPTAAPVQAPDPTLSPASGDDDDDDDDDDASSGDDDDDDDDDDASSGDDDDD
eukprot:55544_1